MKSSRWRGYNVLIEAHLEQQKVGPLHGRILSRRRTELLIHFPNVFLTSTLRSAAYCNTILQHHRT